MDQHFISVIVIGYNVEEYLEKCLSSLFTQTYGKYEIIFVDDGSRDATLAIANRLAKANPILTVVSKENGGIVSARVEGVKAAKGDYVTFLDSDDWANPDMLENLALGIPFTDGEESDIVTSSLYRQTRDGQFEICPANAREEFLTGDAFFQRIMTDAIPHYLFPKLFRREFVLRAGYLEYPHVTLAEDLMTCCFFGLCNPKVHIIESVNYYYRYNALSCTKSGGRQLLGQLTTLDHMRRRLRAVGGETYRELMDYQWFSFVTAYLDKPDIDQRVKVEIVRRSLSEIEDAKSNRYIADRRRRMSLIWTIALFVYYHLPFLAPLYGAVIQAYVRARYQRPPHE